MPYIIALVLLLCSLSAHADQLDFRANEGGFYNKYAFSWKGHQGQTHSMAFKVQSKYVQSSDKASQKFVLQQALDAAYEKARQEARRSAARGVNIQVVKAGGKLRFYGGGGSNWKVDRELERVERLAQKEMDDYLQKRNYTRSGNVIESDYDKMARDNFLMMRPIARAIQDNTRGMDLRGVMNYTLAFLQSIPYETYRPKPGDRMAAIFNTPLNLIARNRGDCDDKSLALGTLLRIMYPNLDMGIVLVPQHAFVAVDMPAKEGDMTLNINGRRHVLVEPVGPEYYEVGRIARSSLNRLRAGFQFREIPDRY